MGTTATPKRIDLKWQYAVRIEGLTVAHFTTVSGIEAEVEITPYHQAGDPDPAVQTPGKRTHSDITLGAGACESNELHQWWEQVYDVEGRGEQDLTRLRRTVFIDVLAKDGETVLRTFRINRAIPKKFKAAEFDAGSSDNIIEEMTLAYKNYTRDR
jgi:phage tail-like protein